MRGSCLFDYFEVADVFTSNDISTRSPINLSFKLSKNFRFVFDVKVSSIYVKRITFECVNLLLRIAAGMVMLFVTSFTVRLPVTASFPSLSVTK